MLARSGGMHCGYLLLPKYYSQKCIPVHLGKNYIYPIQDPECKMPPIRFHTRKIYRFILTSCVQNLIIGGSSSIHLSPSPAGIAGSWGERWQRDNYAAGAGEQAVRKGGQLAPYLSSHLIPLCLPPAASGCRNSSFLCFPLCPPPRCFFPSSPCLPTPPPPTLLLLHAGRLSLLQPRGAELGSSPAL